MNIYHLRYFVDAIRMGSLSASAAQNRVSHSAVSQAIRSLEKLFEGDLLHHRKRGFEPTDLGRKAFEELVGFLDDFEQLRVRVGEARATPSGSLSIMAPQSLLVRKFFEGLKSFRSEYPLVNLKIRTGAAHEVRARLTGGEIDVGFLVDDGQLAPFGQETLRSGNFVVVSRVARERLGSAPLLVTQRDKVEVEHLIRGAKPSAKVNIEIGMEALSWTLIKELVLRDYGHGYLPDYLVGEELESGKLRSVKTPGQAFEYQIKAVWRRQLSRNARLFLTLLKRDLK